MENNVKTLSALFLKADADIEQVTANFENISNVINENSEKINKVKLIADAQNAKKQIGSIRQELEDIEIMQQKWTKDFQNEIAVCLKELQDLQNLK